MLFAISITIRYYFIICISCNFCSTLWVFNSRVGTCNIGINEGFTFFFINLSINSLRLHLVEIMTAIRSCISNYLTLCISLNRKIFVILYC